MPHQSDAISSTTYIYSSYPICISLASHQSNHYVDRYSVCLCSKSNDAADEDAAAGSAAIEAQEAGMKTLALVLSPEFKHFASSSTFDENKMN